MGLVRKINDVLEHKIALDLDARIGMKKAIAIIVVFTMIITSLGYGVIYRLWLKPDSRNTYEVQADLLQERLLEDPGDNKTELDLAIALYLNGKTEEALNICDLVLQKQSADITALLYAGLIKTDLKEYRKAIPLLEKVAAQKPSFQKRLLYFNLGLAYLNTGDYPKAIKNLKTAADVDPGSAMAHYYLGLAYDKAGQYDLAVASMEKAVRIGGDFLDVRQVLETARKHKNNTSE